MLKKRNRTVFCPHPGCTYSSRWYHMERHSASHTTPDARPLAQQHVCLDCGTRFATRENKTRHHRRGRCIRVKAKKVAAALDPLAPMGFHGHNVPQIRMRWALAGARKLCRVMEEPIEEDEEAEDEDDPGPILKKYQPSLALPSHTTVPKPPEMPIFSPWRDWSESPVTITKLDGRAFAGRTQGRHPPPFHPSWGGRKKWVGLDSLA